ncbi:MAG TPA: DRTGG domain-containing protein [Bacteroidales bacterium]|nr:DRTGG domain-containing protein [Bacteroidales bacterium]
MKIADIVTALDLNVFSGHKGLENEITGGYASDLLSDVVGHAEKGNVWITLQTHRNILAVASLKELSAVIIVKGQQPAVDTMEKSNEENIPLLGTRGDTFPMAGKLYEILKDS